MEQKEQNAGDIILKSDLSIASFTNLSKRIDKQFYKTKSVNNVLTEDEAKEVLLPVLQDGKKIQNAVLSSINKNSNEYQLYSALTEEELIMLSVVATSNEPYTASSMSDVSGEDVVNSIGSALGIPGGIKGLRISGLVSAKTGLQIVKAIAKRYAFGYVELAIAIYQFGDCINEVAKVV